MADFTITAGAVAHFSPSVSLKGVDVPLPADATVLWQSSDETVIKFDDPSVVSPDVVPPVAATGTVVTLTVTQPGFDAVTHQHSVDVVAAPMREFDACDFTVKN